MYSLQDHGDMVADALRTRAYEDALRAAVRPGCVVVDIGTGLGLFAILAVRLGARKVYAIESSDMIEVARSIAVANGAADRIEFIHAVSTEVELPERAGVVLSDLRGVLPYFHGHITSVMDARSRFLAGGGALIPSRDVVRAACVSAPELHGTVVSPWLDNRFGLDMSAAHALAANQWRRTVVGAEQLVTAPETIATVDYASVRSPNLDARVSLEATHAADAHGVVVWFDTELAAGIGYSNAPGATPLIYGNAYYPWPRAVSLQTGDRIELRLRAQRVPDNYMWTWESRVARGSAVIAQFRQSDFFSEPIARDRLQRHAASHMTQLNDEGRVDALILGLMGSLPSGDIARRVSESFPGRFERWEDALSRVAELSARYGDTR
jgi:protein arginine N-methyltransferase 1